MATPEQPHYTGKGYWLGLLAATAGYVAMAQLGLRLASIYGNISPVWPATGLAIWLFIRFGFRMWPAVALGQITANLVVADPVPFPVLLVMAAGNVLEATVGCWVWRQVQQRWHGVSDFRDPASAIAASLLAPTFGASVGVIALVAGGVVPLLAIKEVWITWWAGDAIGALTLLPFLLTLPTLTALIAGIGWREALKILALAGATVFLGRLAFTAADGNNYMFALFPLLVVATAWFSGPGADLMTIVLSVIGVTAAAEGKGFFAQGSQNQNLLDLQIFLASVAVAAIVLPAFFGKSKPRAPVLVLLSGWLLSGWMFATLHRQQTVQDAAAFTQLTELASAEINQRMAHYEDALRSGTSLLAASQHVERNEWSAFVNTLNLEDRYPGINGMGVVFPVAVAERATFEEKTRADNAPGFVVHAVPGNALPTQGEHNVITYIEPIARNRPAVGLDLASEANRREAADIARDSGEPQMTAVITLVQDSLKRPGFLLFVPAYREGITPETVSERRRHLIAWAYAPFIIDDFLRGVLDKREDQLQLYLFDQGVVDREHLLFASKPTDGPLPAIERIKLIELEGRQFALGWVRGPKFVAAKASPLLWAAFSFTLGSLMLAGLVLSQHLYRVRAEESAVLSDQERQRSDERLRFILLGSANASFDWNLETDEIYYSPRWWQMFGYQPGELPSESNLWRRWLHPDDVERVNKIVVDIVDHGQPGERIEMRLRHNDGHYLSIRVRAVIVRDVGGKAVRACGTFTDVGSQAL